LFQDIYALAITINYCYWKYNYEHYHARQVKKGALKSYSWKQEKVFISGPAMAFQNKVNPSLMASSAKTFSSKSSLSSAPKKQSNSLQVILSSKLANNGKLTSDKYKKCLENNLCLYYDAEDHRLDFCSKKQIIVTPKGHGASATASKKPSEK